MTNIQYQIASNEEFSGATIFVPGEEPLTVGSSHPDYAAIVGLLLAGIETDEQQAKLLQLVAPAEEVSKVLTKLSERFAYRSGSIFFDGDMLDNALANHLVSIIEKGDQGEDDYAHFVKFAEKLYTNPSKDSIEHLFAFIRNHGITITEDGDFLVYKGVNVDGTSIHSGYGIVDGVEFQNARLQNNVGSVVEIPRSMVDTDRGVACSVGLHVGSHAYASGFARKLLHVKVNPRDVVSVPSDHQDAKIRVSRYTVLEENQNKVETPSVLLGVVTPPVAAPAETEAEDQDEAIAQVLTAENEGAESVVPLGKVEQDENADPKLEELTSEEAAAGIAEVLSGLITTVTGEEVKIGPDNIEVDAEGNVYVFVDVDGIDISSESSDSFVGPLITTLTDLFKEVKVLDLTGSDEDDDDAELSDDEIYFNRKVEEFKLRIPELVKAGTPLKRHRNKAVTAKGRLAFDEAVKQLGLSY